jgi:TonB-dependent SusC/RagA subfamily outer membrane receptor
MLKGMVSDGTGNVPSASVKIEGTAFRLRGVKSIQGNLDPLYVIDGVIVSNSSANVSQTALSNQIGGASPGSNRMVDINPTDIETLNIINGAAAAAQYGSRAANGVVLITTKREKVGAPKVSFSTTFNADELCKRRDGENAVFYFAFLHEKRRYNTGN